MGIQLPHPFSIHTLLPAFAGAQAPQLIVASGAFF
jgi:hypothetical protein